MGGEGRYLVYRYVISFLTGNAHNVNETSYNKTSDSLRG